MRHVYALTVRPASTFTVPRGSVAFGVHPDFKHGTVEYDHPLSEEDREHFSLVYLSQPKEETARLVAEPLKEYAAEHLESFAEDPDSFKMAVGQAIDKMGVHATREEIAPLVVEHLKASLGATKEPHELVHDALASGDVSKLDVKRPGMREALTEISQGDRNKLDEKATGELKDALKEIRQTTFNSFIAGVEEKARLDKEHIEKIAATGQKMYAFKDREGRDILVHPSTRVPGTWQMTHFTAEGEPAGHTEAKTAAAALEDARQFGAILRPERAKALTTFAEKPTQTGIRGGQFYVSAAGTKIYVRDK